MNVGHQFFWQIDRFSEKEPRHFMCKCSLVKNPGVKVDIWINGGYEDIRDFSMLCPQFNHIDTLNESYIGIGQTILLVETHVDTFEFIANWREALTPKKFEPRFRRQLDLS